MRRLNRGLEGAYIAVVLISVQYAIKGISFADDRKFNNSTLLQKYHVLSTNNIPPDQDERDYAINVMSIVEDLRGQHWILDSFGNVYLGVMKHISLLLPKGDDNEI